MIELAGGELQTERRGPVQWILFNRPQARNALTWAMYEALVKECERINQDSTIRVVVITGNGQAFAAGTDISQFQSFKTAQDALDYERNANHVAEAVESVSVPVIAAIAGPCTGGGASIATCCDIRIASPSARFGIPIARTLGNCLSQQNYARLVAAFGLPRAKQLLMTARLMNAQDLLTAGYVAEVVTSEEGLLPRAQSLAEEIAAFAPLTLRATKLATHRVRNQLFPIEEDKDLIEMCYLSEDFREGVASFLEKRKPNWKGR
ncbi:MAG TPA: enoyl-CoA hydratase/isomerase family protein [Candidatus Dormibacteraeota bacterium]|nr:enoyl-CoA hydratase/isomerase family protein [Candidatus Dormibacteraeota bacterium]